MAPYVFKGVPLLVKSSIILIQETRYTHWGAKKVGQWKFAFLSVNNGHKGMGFFISISKSDCCCLLNWTML